MNKLTLSLSVQELRILAALLNFTLTSNDQKYLKEQAIDHFLVLSCLHEFYLKVDKKKQDIDAFGYTPGKTIGVHLKRSEALAFYLLVERPDEVGETRLPSIPDSTVSLIRGIVGDIHKKFLV